MTPNEFTQCYDDFMKDDEVYYISEHRKSYDNSQELEEINHQNPDITLFPISITRFNAVEASKELLSTGLKVNVFHIVKIKPLELSKKSKDKLD